MDTAAVSVARLALTGVRLAVSSRRPYTEAMSSPVVIFGGSHIALQSALALARRQIPVWLRPIPAECSELPAQLPEGIVLEPLPRMLSGSVPELPADCCCAIVASDNEAFNLQLTLLLEAHYPQLRIVTRLFNQTLGRDLEQRFARVQVLSVSELAAPVFAAAALCEGVEAAWAEQEQLYARLRGQTEPQRITATPLPIKRRRPRQTPSRPRLRVDPLLLGVLTLLALVIGAGTLFFSTRHALPTGDALYFVITTLTTTGYGDYSLKDYPFSTKLAGMALMLAGGSLFAVLFALLTDTLFRLRLASLLGQRDFRGSGHVVLCGAGTVGMRVAESLQLTGVEVVVIEQNPDGRFNARIRELGFPLLIADATLEATLLRAGCERARAVICATEQDLINLQIALSVRALHPGQRMVVRIFDQAFAREARRNFELDVVLSASALAARAFAEAAHTPTQSD